MTIHSVSSYIGGVIRTNGFFYNVGCVDIQFWTGYRIFIRNNMDEYESVEDWIENYGEWEYLAEDGYGNYTEYVFRDPRVSFNGLGINRGSPDIIDASFVSYDLDGDSLITEILEKTNKWILLENDRHILYDTVQMHRKRHNYTQLPFEVVSIESFIDSTSRAAIIEGKRMKLNMMDFYDK